MEEKGIKGGAESLRNTGNPPSGADRKFNAFSQMALAAKKASRSKEQSKSEETNTEEKEAVRSVQIQFGDETIKVNGDGTVDPENVKYPKGSVLKFTGAGKERANFAQLKVL
jgi:hypothetical protein